MLVERNAAARGHVRTGWLDSRHTFSFGQYHDPQWMGFGPLRVINEDIVAPGAGFPPHRHANMEILTYVLDGALAHKDGQSNDGRGSAGVLRPGELQWMSAGHGIEHSEFNASQDAPVHFLQIWIQPDRVNAKPDYDQRAFDPAQRRGRWTLLASPDGSEGSIAIRQQAWLRGVVLDEDAEVPIAFDASRMYWLHVARGDAELQGRRLRAGDALGFVGESGAQRVKGLATQSDILLFDLPT